MTKPSKRSVNHTPQTVSSLDEQLFNRRPGLARAGQSVGRSKACNASTQDGYAPTRFFMICQLLPL